MCVFLPHLHRDVVFANVSPTLKAVDLTKLKAALLLTIDRQEYNLYLTFIIVINAFMVSILRVCLTVTWS